MKVIVATMIRQLWQKKNISVGFCKITVPATRSALLVLGRDVPKGNVSSQVIHYLSLFPQSK